MNSGIFMIIITALFALSAISYGWDGNWVQMFYSIGAVMLNVSVLIMAAK
jgi:hypothetical protein